MTGRSLAELADEAGYSPADLAVLSGLDLSTISRLCRAEDWLDRISGRSLQALSTVIPGLLRHVEQQASARRVEGLVVELAASDVVVDTASAERLITDGSLAPEHLGSALQAAVLIMRGDTGLAAQHLTRCFGRNHDAALSALFSGDLVRDTSTLLTAAGGLAGDLRGQAGLSFNAFMGLATVAHHTARVTGAQLDGDDLGGVRQTAFLARSTTIGLILSTGDPGLAARYGAEITRSPVAALIEDWALPTYCRDVRPSTDFHVPRATVLTRTAAEVLRELEQYPPAYVAYLAGVYLPRALRRDPSLGGRRSEIRATLLARRALDLDEPEIADPVDRLLAILPKGDS